MIRTKESSFKIEGNAKDVKDIALSIIKEKKTDLQTLEYTTVDKSTWGDGKWSHEPDKRQWQDLKTGYPCLIVRNHDVTGSLCGYVGVQEGHPFYKKNDYDFDLDVHGGITFTGVCQSEKDPSRGVCHITPENDNIWWLGFDCSHSGDYMPKMEAYFKTIPELTQSREELEKMMKNFPGMTRDIYRDFAYVTAEVESLALQLKKLEK